MTVGTQAGKGTPLKGHLPARVKETTAGAPPTGETLGTSLPHGAPSVSPTFFVSTPGLCGTHSKIFLFRTTVLMR